MDNPSSQPPVPPQSRRRWFQFSLRTLFLSVLVLAFGSNWLRLLWQHKLEERRLVAELRAGGADIWYDYQEAADARVTMNPTPPGPAWIRGWLGDDVFATPTFAHVKNAKSEQQLLEKLAELESIESVLLELQDRSSRAFNALRGMPKLTAISIEGQVDCRELGRLPPMLQLRKLKVREPFDGRILNVKCEDIASPFPRLNELALEVHRLDDDAKALSGMQSLESLELFVAVPNADKPQFVLHDCPRLKKIHVAYATSGMFCEAVELTNLPRLETLDLAARRMRLRGVPKLRKLDAMGAKELRLDGLDGLEEADLYGTQLAAESLAQLVNCRKLSRLNLGASSYGDDVMENVARLSALAVLDVSATPITDLGLAKLTALKELTELDLSGCEINDASLELLHNMKNLRTLNLRQTKVTLAGVKRIEAAIPGLKCVTVRLASTAE